MTTQFKKVNYTLQELIDQTDIGRIISTAPSVELFKYEQNITELSHIIKTLINTNTLCETELQKIT